MNILVVSPSRQDTAPGQRFRLEQWARVLEPHGFRFHSEPFESAALHRVLYQSGHLVQKASLVVAATARRIGLLARARHFDAAVIHREATMVGPPIIEEAFRLLGLPFVYDFDDPIWMTYDSPTHGALARLKWPSKTARICRLASAVTVGNRLLAEYAAQFSSSVHVVPSTIDLARYPARARARCADDTVTIGWTGSHSTLPFLDLVHAPLAALAKTTSYRMLVVSHTSSYGIPDVETIAHRWSADSEAIDLAAMDIGIAPFPDEGWTPWRCHGKILQYMALGIPVVASPIGIVPDYIEDGVTGFLASTHDEWVAKLDLLVRDPALRARVGAAGRRVIEERYSSVPWALRFGQILQSVAS